MDTLNINKFYLIILLLFVFSCKTNQYTYYTSYDINHGFGYKYKLILSKNNTFVFYASNVQKDTITGIWSKKKDSVFLQYNIINSNKIVMQEFTTNNNYYNFSITIDEDNIFDDTNTKIYLNNILYDKNKTLNYYKQYGELKYIYIKSLLGNYCIKIKNRKANSFIIKIKYNRLLSEYSLLKASKFVKKRNRLYPVFFCPNENIDNNVYLNKRD